MIGRQPTLPLRCGALEPQVFVDERIERVEIVDRARVEYLADPAGIAVVSSLPEELRVGGYRDQQQGDRSAPAPEGDFVQPVAGLGEPVSLAEHHRRAFAEVVG